MVRLSRVKSATQIYCTRFQRLVRLQFKPLQIFPGAEWRQLTSGEFQGNKPGLLPFMMA
jgi:hypothetical protein